MSEELNDVELKAIEKIQKLLDTAAKSDQPGEVANATALAQKLMLQHNLNSEVVARNSGAGQAKREQQLVEGGFYAFHRDLWGNVAKLNFCHYWTQKYKTEEKIKQKRYNKYGDYLGMFPINVQRSRHALIGRTVNVKASIALAVYLQGAIEREVRVAIGDTGTSLTSNYAYSMRLGMAAEITMRLRARRRAEIEKEARAQEVARRKATGATAGTALTLASFSKSEKEANLDFRYGEGFSAEVAAKRAEDAARRQEMEQAYTLWAAANPKAARSAFEFKDKKGNIWHYGRASGGGGAGSRGGGSKVDDSAYSRGWDRAKNIGLDQQAGDKRANQQRITGSKSIHL